MFDTTCTFPLKADLFAQAIHPSEPLVAVGLSSGHVSTLRLPPVGDDGRAPKRRRGSNGTDIVDTAWQTKRHKGSCRCLAYSIDGRNLYSAGTDGIIKAADTETGRVTGKVVVPSDTTSANGDLDPPTVVHALSPQTLLLGTDSGALHLYDLRDPAPTAPSDTKPAFTNSKPAQTHRPHPTDISSLIPLPPSSTSTSGYSKQFLTTGGTTLALTDLRRGVLVKSEDQEELLLSSLYITGLSAKKSTGSTGEKAIIGGGDGVITLWEKGQWDDQDERIVVSKEKETLDCMAVVPDGVGTGFGRRVAVGVGDGSVKFVQLGKNQVVDSVLHDEVEGVIGLGFDVGGRMISGGGQVVKVWEESMVDEEGNDEKNDVSDSGEDIDDSDNSEEEANLQKRKKKRKRGKVVRGDSGSGINFVGLD